MSETSLPRRQPPSPLVFSPETVLPAIPLQSQASTSSTHASGANTVSMPFVRRHVYRRLKAAKQDCDKELQRVTNSITAFFEERLRDNDHELFDEREQRELKKDRDRDIRTGDVEALCEPFVLQPAALRSALQFDEVSSDGGYEAEPEGTTSRGRQPSISSVYSLASHSPASLRRQSTLPRENKSMTNLPSSAGTSSPATSATPPPEVVVSPRKRENATSSSNGQWAGQSLASRRLSRTIHIPVRQSRSGASSRSTSRSRSPLPRSAHPDATSRDRRASRILVDEPGDPIMNTLYEIIGVATDVMDMSISQLTAEPKICERLVTRVQNIGKVWDEHPDWHGRNWYVQVLLAIASLSRVVEWWEAEKQFWNFDEHDDEQEEPLLFVMKPPDDPAAAVPSTPSMRHEISDSGSALRVGTEEEARLRMARTTSAGRRSRGDATKDLLATTAAKEQKDADHLRGGSKFDNESARVLATERLRLQAETAQNQNIVIELDLDGDHLLWMNYAWRNIIGGDPEDLWNTRISKLLAASDWHVFRDATRRLMEDDSHTVEVRFRVRISDQEADRDPSAPVLYQQMEGKGMLMIDREEGHPTHTMWVVKPISSPEYLQPPPSILLEHGDVGDEPSTPEPPPQVGFSERRPTEPVTPFPFARPISTALILCRICECSIPQWYFEKHNETCSEVHRLEAEIGECNESISELRNTIRELQSAMDRSSPMTIPEYRGMPIFSPSSSPGTSSPLSLLRAPLKMKRMSVKKMQRQILERLEDILQLASEIKVPALREEEAQEPIERQRLLSPGSERKISQIRRWSRPTIEDQALTQLIDDTERVMRQKIDNAVRMQNTIRYSEKIRQEWEEKVEQTLTGGDEEQEQGSDDEGSSDEEEDLERDRHQLASLPEVDDDQSSITSEYGFGMRNASADLTPQDPSPTLYAASIERTDSAASTTSSVPMPVPQYHWPSSNHHTRSSTPSSISSPLALAQPIIASSHLDDMPPPMDLNDGHFQLTQPIPVLHASLNFAPRPRRSPQNLEPKLLVTPPLSPMVSPKDQQTARKSHRRLSNAQPMISPTSSVANVPLSPRIPSVAPLSRTTPTSIKDFEIIKPISKGAFGSVFLAKKKVTGDYFAIKVLKKADMIAKNQITNVKAERMILMKQAESPFVAKLYFTFQSKENLYLVMEYLNGGDCAALIKTLGSLPEEWSRNYIAEVVLGLESLHQLGIVHRDLKPDNLLIDQHGHLKLTDFGLSRIGLLGRQTRDGQLSFERGVRTRPRHNSRPPSIDSYMSSPLLAADLYGSYFSQRTPSNPRPGSSPHLPLTDDISESSGSESVYNLFPRRNGNRQANDSPLQSFATELTTDLRSHPTLTPGGTPPGEQKVVGTPDYLAPETILGLRGDDAAVDWWALGVITYEFLYGIPPFHDETPEKVFENILSGHVEWHEDYIEISDEAKDFIQRLLTLDPVRRLGANGAEEVKAHPFFAGIDWSAVTTTEAAFIPQVTDPESTDYFDPRGATVLHFSEEEQQAAQTNSLSDSPQTGLDAPLPATHSAPVPMTRGDANSTPSDDDFGSFSFKNLPVLKQANDDVIRKLRTDQLAPLTHTLSEPATLHSRRKSISNRIKKPSSVITTLENPPKPSTTSPPSPATSTSSIASSPSRGPPTPGSASGHARKPSDLGAVERFKLNHLEGDVHRRNSMPSRLRTASVSTSGDGSQSDAWSAPPLQDTSRWDIHSIPSHTPPSSVASIDLKRAPDPHDRAVTCLLAEDNPITAKIIETLLIRLGCRCVVVADGSEAISVAMGDIKFDCILMDLHMPILDGEGAARYIKTTNNKNANTPIIAVSAYSGSEPMEGNNLFAAYLAKPVQKADLLAVLRQLGFKTSTAPSRGNGGGTSRVTAPTPPAPTAPVPAALVAPTPFASAAVAIAAEGR